ncbi:hypothetical protein HYH02_013220 [Chlamydomonas schloesseri]|uniref:Protein kinase domain-containing protein n=1 Tax=Chlamydomonas schloesseri TaxID=2026947 RepID=A0A835SX94_9CHLO|nr:hypothetical protein HYH02_013220 [Chlamydomonas schloesseri]|eukprot:KAG2431643.1 hypothetical protein HYH02_013220 [Chlamydomonas schloesseri]
MKALALRAGQVALLVLTSALLLAAQRTAAATDDEFWQQLESSTLVELKGGTWTWQSRVSPSALSRNVSIIGPGVIRIETSASVLLGTGASVLTLRDVVCVFAAGALNSSAGPLPVTAGPIAAVNTTSLGLILQNVQVLASFSALGTVSGFWAASTLLNNIIDVATGLAAPSLVQGPLKVPSIELGRVSATDLLLLPTDGERQEATSCYTSGVPVFDSTTLRQALGNPRASTIFVYQGFLLSPVDFSFRAPANITGSRGDVTLYGCAGTALDVNLNYTRGSVVVGGGGGLAIRGLRFTNSPLMNQLLWPRNLSPLLPLVDCEVGGRVALEDVGILTPVAEDLAAYLGAFVDGSYGSGGGGSGSGGGGEGALLPVYSAANSSHVAISRWRLTGAMWEPSPGISAAAAAASVWDFTNVNATTLPPTACLSSNGVQGIRVSSGKQLRQLLSDDLIPALEIVGNITFVPSEWPPEASGPAGGEIFVNGTKEVYACHPNPGSRYVIDFGDLGQVVFVFGTLTWRGSLLMTNPRASPRRSWLYLLIGALSVETDGVIQFTGVEVRSNVSSPFTNAGDPFWATQCGSLCDSFIPDRAAYRNVSYYDAFIYEYRFYKSDWVAVSQGRNITGAGFWGYTDVALTWRPSSTAAAGGGGGVPAAAIAVPVAVGGALLIAGAIAAFVFVRRRRARRAAAAAAAAAATAARGGGAKPGDQPPELTVVIAGNGARPGSGNLGGSAEARDGSTPPQGSSGAHVGAGAGGAAGGSTTGGAASQATSIMSGSMPTEARIEELKRAMMGAGAGVGGMHRNEQITLTELLGEGTFGKVYKGVWRGTTVAVKTMVLPTNMSGKEKREKMAVMETAISSSLSHPNIVQTYTYAVLPVKGDQLQQPAGIQLGAGASLTVESTSPLALMAAPDQSGVHSWEVRLVLEFCDRGSLRDVLNDALRAAQAAAGVASMSAASNVQDADGANGGAGGGTASGGGDDDMAAAARERSDCAPSGSTHGGLAHGGGGAAAGGGLGGAGGRHVSCPLGYLEALDNVLDVARAMLHMHSENIVHGDLKARNILLKSGASGDGRTYVAKVADFGLSLRIDPTETHVSNVYQGTITHMAPEVLLHGKVSKASDVYAFAILMWEAYTAGQAFKGTPRALLGHEVTKMNRRPQFPLDTPFEFQLLACRCWESDPSIRPSFEHIIGDLMRMRAKLVGGGGGGGGMHASLSNSTLGGVSASTTANQFGAHPSGALGGGAGTASGASPGLPLVPVSPLLQYPHYVNPTTASMTLGGSESDGTALQMVDAHGQQLFFVQGVDGSTMGSLGTDSFMIPPGGGQAAAAGALLPAHTIAAGRPVPPMPPILEATGGTPDTSAPLQKLGGGGMGAYGAITTSGSAAQEDTRR